MRKFEIIDRDTFIRDIPNGNYDDVVLPKRGTISSAGYDFYSVISVTLKPGERKVIAATGPLKKKYLDKEINEFTERSIERRDNFFEKQKKSFQIINDEEEVGYYTFSSIVDNGDAIGSVILISTDVPISDVEDKMCIVLSKLLSKQFVD